ncbi:hypothetical protein [uncultured Lactobacillus sp.]|uniref:hypothetical protein n=1 Tax=uncultured Lactobacillus sp. TaxID=153152 RepID=UPI0023BD4539|nr:hypothetical protein [uncultured Lactobacillus sp.]MDE7056141.1 hypothetical protein [Lactobacillus sp.]
MLSFEKLKRYFEFSSKKKSNDTESLDEYRKSNHVNAKKISYLVNVWIKYTDVLLSNGASADWEDRSKKGQDIILLTLKAPHKLKIKFTVELREIGGKTKEELEKNFLVAIAEEIVGIVDTMDLEESDAMDYAYKMNLDTNQAVDLLHFDEEYIFRFAQTIFLIAKDNDFLAHASKLVFVEGIDFKNMQTILKEWRLFLKNMRLVEDKTTNEWIQDHNGQKKLIRMYLSCYRASGRRHLKIPIYADNLDVSEGLGIQDIFKNLILKEINRFEKEFSLSDEDKYDSITFQKLIDDTAYFENLKQKL